MARRRPGSEEERESVRSLGTVQKRYNGWLSNEPA
jgi:hypothetical protein